MRVNEVSEKDGLKLNIQKTQIISSGPITSWELEGENVLLFSSSKAMTNLDSILKSRHYFADKGPSSQGYGFSSGHICMWVGP